jgi:hypothetical protein
MMTRLHIGLKGIGLGLALSFAGLVAAPAGAAPISSMLNIRDAAALPVIEAQARHGQRRPARRVVRRNNNGAAVAGALVGAAIIGGAIIANSEAQRREERRRAQYYYGGPQYYGGYQPYYEPQPRPRRVYRQPSYEPTYQPQPRVRYRQPQYNDPAYYQPQPRQWNGSRAGSGRMCIVNTPDKETPYHYAPC